MEINKAKSREISKLGNILLHIQWAKGKSQENLENVSTGQNKNVKCYCGL
jgi:hypothetical protein